MTNNIIVYHYHVFFGTGYRSPGACSLKHSVFRNLFEEFEILTVERSRMKQRGALRTQRTAKDLADMLTGEAF